MYIYVYICVCVGCVCVCVCVCVCIERDVEYQSFRPGKQYVPGKSEGKIGEFQVRTLVATLLIKAENKVK